MIPEIEMDFMLRGMPDFPVTVDNTETFFDDLDDGQSLDDGNDLLLLDSDVDTLDVLSDYLLQFESTRDRVDRWLLHKLRISRSEMFALRRSMHEYWPSPIPDWANLALSLWNHSGTHGP